MSWIKKLQLHAVMSAVFVLLIETQAFASYVEGYHFEQADSKAHLYKLLTGGFGSFVMVFMGMGGMASLFITRSSRSRQGVPFLGVAMLAVAISLFAFRISVQAGVMGHEYIEW